MWVGVLGGIEAMCDRPVRLGSTRQRALLAVLASRHGDTCATDSLIEAIWEGDSPPERGRAALQTLVSRLRTAIADAGGDAASIRHVDGRGYRLDRGGVVVDASEFDRLVSEATARHLAGAPDLATETVDHALALFRGEPYAEFEHCEWARADVARLSERRADALELLIESLLDQGAHREALSRLEPAISEHPFRERLRALHMTALHRAGRHRDAVAAYQAFRRQLDDEIGLEPSVALRELEGRILRHDPTLEAPTAGRPVRGYRLLARLGSDHLGDRWRATQPGLGREVVVTIIDPERTHGAELLAEFDTSATLLGRLEGPPVTAVIDAWRDATGAYLVTGPPKGEPLTTRLSRPWTGELARAWLDQIVAGVAAARAEGLAHGHLTPDCVHVEGSSAMVSGWGLRSTDATDALDEEALTELARLLGQDRGVAVTARRNPYRGLATFEAVDAPWYRGRDHDVDALVAAVAAHRFVTVVGGSGTGKSSLVRAGLIPRLANGTVVVMTPGRSPGTGLAATLEAMHAPSDETRIIVIDQLEELYTLSSEAERRMFAECLADRLDLDPSVRFVATLRSDHLARPLADPLLGPLMGMALVPLPPMTAAGLTQAVVDPSAAVGLEVDIEVVAALVSAVARRPEALPLLQFTMTELVDRASNSRITEEDLAGLGGVEGCLARHAEGVYEQLDDEARQQARFVLTRLAAHDEGTSTRRRVDLDELIRDEVTGVVVETFVAARLICLDADLVSRRQLVSLTHEAIASEWPRLAGWLAEDHAALIDLTDLRLAVGPWLENDRDDDRTLRGLALARASSVADRRPDLLTSDEVALVVASHRRAASASRRRRGMTAALAVFAVVAVIAAAIAFVQRRDALRGERSERHLRLDSEIAGLALEAKALASSEPDLAMLLAVEAWRRAPGPETESAVLSAIGGQPQLRSFIDVAGADDSAVTDILSAGDRIAIRYGHTVTVRAFDGLDTAAPTFEVDAAAKWALSADGAEVATAGPDGTIRRWSTRQGQSAPSETRVGTNDEAPPIVFLADRRLAVASGSSVVILDDRNRVDQVIQLELPPRELISHPVTPQLLVSTSAGVDLVDVGSGRDEQLVGFFAATSMRFSRDGSRAWLMTGSVATGSTLSEIDLLTGQTVRDMALPMRLPDRVVELSRSRLLVTDRRGSGFVIGPTWASPTAVDVGLVHPVVRSGATVVAARGHGLVIADLDARSALSQPMTPPITGLASITADGRLMVHREGSTFVAVDSTTGDATVLAMPSTPGTIQLSPDGRILAVTGTISTDLFDVTTGRELGVQQSNDLVAFSPDSTMVAISGFAGLVVRRLPGLEPISATVPSGPGDVITEASWSPDSSVLAVTGTNAPTRLIDPLTGTRIGTELDLDAGDQIRWSPDGARLVIISTASRSRVADAATGEVIRSLPTVNGPATVAGWASDGQRFVVMRAAQPNDSVLEITDVDAGVRIGPPISVAPLTSIVNGVGRIGDDRVHVFAIGEPASVISLDPDTWAATACRIANRNLTTDEWEQHLGSISTWRPTCDGIT